MGGLDTRITERDLEDEVRLPFVRVFARHFGGNALALPELHHGMV